MVQALHVLVLVVKRHWVDDKAEAWAYIEARIRQLLAPPPSHPTASPSQQLLLLRLLQALLTEFAVWPTTPLRISMEAHLQAHVSFEKMALLPLVSLCASLLQSTVSSWQGRGGEEAQLLRCGVRSVEQALSWEFRIAFTHTLQALSNSATDDASTTLSSSPSSSLLVEPPTEWRPLLLQSSLVEQLTVALRIALHSSDAALLHSALRSLLQLASLKGAVLSHTDLPSHIHSLVAACSQLLPEQRMRAEVSSGVAAVLCRLWDVHGLRGLLTSSFALWLHCLLELSLRIVQSEGFSSAAFTSDTSTGFAESLEQLLGTWASLVMQRHDGEPSTDSEVQRAHGLIDEASEKLLALYIERRLQRRSTRGVEARKDKEGALLEDEEEEEEDEQFAGEDNEQPHLTHLAFLARVHPQRMLTSFRSALSQLISHYAALITSSQASTTELAYTQAEQLLFLFRLLQSALTDEAEDEVPSLLLEGLGSAEQRLSLQAAIAELVRFASILSREVETGRFVHASPLLTTCALQVISRILAVYLLSASSPSSPTGYLTPDFAIPLATSLATSSITLLLTWPGEVELHSASLQLLSVLCEQPITAPAVVSSPAYRQLVQLLVRSATLLPSPSSPSSASSASLDRLDGASLTSLIRLFLVNCSEAGSRLAVLSPIRSRLHSVLSLPYFSSHAAYREDSGLILHLTATMRMLSGVVEATKDVSFDNSFSFLSSLYPDLLSLLQLHLPHSSASSLVLSVLELFSASASRQMAFMSRQQTALFLEAVAQLLRLWLDAWQARTARLSSPSSSASPSLPQVEVELAVDAYEAEVAALLSLLSTVVDEDLQAASPLSVLRAGDVCLLALSSLAADSRFVHALPHLHAEVQQAFHHLLMETVTTHTRRLGEMHREARDAIVRVALAQLQQQHTARPEVQRLALSALQAMAAFHCKHAGEGEAVAAMFGPYLPQLLRCLFHLLLYMHLSPAVLDSLADALLPCLMAAESTYADISRSVIEQYRGEMSRGGESGGDAVGLERLQRGFLDLYQGHGVQQSLSMRNKQAFRSNCRHFIHTVRVIVQCR